MKMQFMSADELRKEAKELSSWFESRGKEPQVAFVIMQYASMMIQKNGLAPEIMIPVHENECNNPECPIHGKDVN